MKPKIFLVEGQKFGLLTFIREAERRNKIRFGLFRCDCGTMTEVNLYSVRYGQSLSCGCYQAAVASAAQTKHGLTHSPEYTVWRSMKERCYLPHSENYPRYGGRGITVCDRWRDSFESFLADMGRRPSPLHSIDRRDNNGNYEPANCRWATRDEQQQNRSVTQFLRTL